MTMKRAQVYVNDRPAGVLTREDDGSYTFGYNQETIWAGSLQATAVSLTLPKREDLTVANTCFPFF